MAFKRFLLEWDERGEDSSDKQLWEDNWDDDNVEDEFSCQLRYCAFLYNLACIIFNMLLVCVGQSWRN